MRALAIYEQELGPLHSDMVNSLNNLAVLYRRHLREVVRSSAVLLRVVVIKWRGFIASAIGSIRPDELAHQSTAQRGCAL